MSTPRTKAALWIAPAVTIAALFGSYVIASATGGWVTSGKQVITASTKLTPDDLKGWMTLQQASDGLGIGVDRLIALLDAPAGTAIAPATAFKDLEALVPGFELSSFKLRLAEALASAPGASLTPSASGAAPTASGSSSSATHAPTGSGTPGTSSITGQTTLRQAATAAGIDPERLRREAGLPASVGLDVALKDIKNSVPGFEIQSVRDAVERLR